MRAVVVYESMFGSTRQIAEAIAGGLTLGMDAHAVRAADMSIGDVAAVDLLVVGAPTHAHGMPRAATRKGAPSYVEKPGSTLVLEPGADTAPGVREWLASLGELRMAGAAFDTRVKGPAALTGRASRGIAKSLAGCGLVLVVPPTSFLVDAHSGILAGETERARAWGGRLARTMAENRTTRTG